VPYLRGMNVLSVENVSKSYGVQSLFQGLSFGISKGQKVALVAKNGAGKSTLMKILCGRETADEGLVVYNKEIRIAFLAQEDFLNDDQTILENIFSADNEMTRAIAHYESAMISHDEKAIQRAHDEMDKTGAWSYEAKARQILGQLSVHDLTPVVKKLSGGQKRRVALAKVLIEEPDFLLLDEPTNHLDLDMIEWLEDYLVRTQMTLFMITHDRYFLENVTDEILEMENGVLYRYKGNFSYYLEKKAEREMLDASTREKQLNLYKRELEWARKMPRARTTKSKSRMDGFAELKDRVSRRLDDDSLELEINVQRMGSKIIELHKVKKTMGETLVLDGFDYVFKTGEKLGLVGRNGTGKTTFLNLLTNKIEPDGGKVVVGETVVFGYFSQHVVTFKEGQRLLDAVREVADFIPLTKGKTISASQMLERFMFPKHMHFNLIEKLSGGERKRLQLLLILMKNPNFLILDEPTNDLDVFTLAVLEEYLLQYPGCLIIVSHDRYFLDKLVDHLFVLNGKGGVKDILGNYHAYRVEMDREEAARIAEEKRAVQPKEEKSTSSAPKQKFSYKQKLEFDQLEKEIPLLEAERAQLESKIASGLSDHVELMTAVERLALVVEKLDTMSFRWLELSELVS
jgi:ATP-binding cassette subfamily F protein uup